MLEKNGNLKLTEEELAAIQKGEVPEKVLTRRGETPTEVKELVKVGEYDVKERSSAGTGGQ